MDTQFCFRQLFADKGKEFVNVIKEFNFEDFNDLQDLMKAFSHIKIRDNFILDAYYAGDMSFGAVMKLYAVRLNCKNQYYPVSEKVLNRFKNYEQFLDWFRDENKFVKKMLIQPFTDGHYIEGTIPWEASETVPRLEKYLVYDFTPIAIWEALLLLEVTHLYLPHFWHAGVGRGMLVVDDITLVEACTNSDFVRGDVVDYSKLLGNTGMLLPIVEIKSSSLAYASYCYWNDWTGLSCVTHEITKIGSEVIYHKIDERVLIEYNCRVRF